jgi:hypothetical protein
MARGTPARAGGNRYFQCPVGGLHHRYGWREDASRVVVLRLEVALLVSDYVVGSLITPSVPKSGQEEAIEAVHGRSRAFALENGGRCSKARTQAKSRGDC